MTEIDFITRTTSTSLIAEEKGEEIVQLSYLKQVRTLIEAFICKTCETQNSHRMVRISKPLLN